MIYCSDGISWVKAQPDVCVDLVLTDPPYDLPVVTQQELLSHFRRISRHGAIVFAQPERPWPLPDQHGFWIKPISTKNTSRRYSRFVELIQVYACDVWNADRHWSQYTNVFMDLVDGATDHPYEKPTTLIRRLILNHTSPGMTILDPFMGSGTIGVVAEVLGRDFIGLEQSPSIFNRAQMRIMGGLS